MGLTLICPINSERKGYPFEVVIPDGLQVSRVVLSDQVKCLDWTIRGAERICELPAATVREALGKLGALLGAQAHLPM